MIEPHHLTDAVVGLLDRWRDEGTPLAWHLFPILADALEDAGYSRGNFLAELRDGELPKWDSELKGVLAPVQLRGGDWQSVFAYAGEPDAGDGSASVGAVPPGSDVPTKPFSRWDVAEVLGTSEGENDRQNWLVYGRLKDGRYFFITAGCDYTGWG